MAHLWLCCPPTLVISSPGSLLRVQGAAKSTESTLQGLCKYLLKEGVGSPGVTYKSCLMDGVTQFGSQRPLLTTPPPNTHTHYGPRDCVAMESLQFRSKEQIKANQTTLQKAVRFSSVLWVTVLGQCLRFPLRIQSWEPRKAPVLLTLPSKWRHSLQRLS